MGKRVIFTFFLIPVFLTGCGQSGLFLSKSDRPQAPVADKVAAAPPSAAAPTAAENVAGSAPGAAEGSGGVLDAVAVKQAQANTLKLIKNGSLRMRVEKYAQARSALGRCVAEQQGYISQEKEETNSVAVTGELTVRVEAARFDALLDALARLGAYVHAKNVTVSDVTEEYVDLESRLKAKREVEVQYLQILKQARSVRETLDVEQVLRQVQEEIEAAQGRLKFLDHQVSLSTIQVSMYEDLPGSPREDPAAMGFFAKLWRRLGEGWDSLKRLVLAIAENWPGWVFFLLVVWFVTKLVKKLRREGHFRRPQPPVWQSPYGGPLSAPPPGTWGPPPGTPAAGFPPVAQGGPPGAAGDPEPKR